MKNQKNGNFNTQIERYFAIKIPPSLKMQKIIKQRNLNEQLFENANFAFMKIFDFLCPVHLPGQNIFCPGQNQIYPKQNNFVNDKIFWP